jgi:hypothetical protein
MKGGVTSTADNVLFCLTDPDCHDVTQITHSCDLLQVWVISYNQALVAVPPD